MSNSEQNPQQGTTTTDLSTAATGGTGSGVSAGSPKIELTAEQLQATIQQAVSAAIANMPQPRQQEPVAPPPQSSDPFASIGDEDLIDGRTAKQFFKNQDQRYSQMLSGVGEMYKGQVSMLEQNSRILYPDIWKKYGQEIKKEIEQLKTQKFVTAEDYDRVISMIKGQHIDDFLEERVQQALQNAPPGDTGAPALGVSTGVATANIPDAWKKHLQEANLTIRDVEQMLDKRRENYGYAPTLEQYFKQMENDVIIKDDRAFKANNLIPERK